MPRTFHPAPGWPPPPAGWTPPAGWAPDPGWPEAPEGWVYWTDTTLLGGEVEQAAPVVPGGDAAVRQAWWVRFGWLMALVAGVAGYVVVLTVMISTQNILMFPSLLLIGSMTVPMSVLLLVYAVEYRAGHHGALVTVTVIAGAVIGTTTAALLEYNTLKAMPWLGMVAVGLIEEAAKLIVPVVVFWLMRQRTPGLGLVLGVASGAGFAAAETMGYGLVALIASKGNLAEVDATLLLRGLLSPAGHVAWSGMTCAALWRLGERPPARYGWTVFMGAYLLAAMLHAVWDGTTSLAPHVLVAAVSAALLIGLTILENRRLRRAWTAPRPLPPVAG